MSILSSIKSYIQRIHNRKRFPTSVIYGGAYLDKHSELGRYSVLFKDVTFINSKLGAYSYVQSRSGISNTEIGKFCSIASGVEIGLPQHLISGVSSHPIFYLKNTPLPKVFSEEDTYVTTKRTYIGHDVWVGKNAMIMSGINVGIGAVIGAGAVVTKDVPAYAVVGGVPAKIIKYRFNDELRNELAFSEWWNMPDDWLKANFLLFRSPDQLLAVLREFGKSRSF